MNLVSMQVVCHFFTDGLVVNRKVQQTLLKEKSLYGDLEFQPLLGGVEFGLRFLYHAKWASANYDFQYFLRVDDDYFVCIKKLLNELPLRPKENLIWGNFHCGSKHFLDRRVMDAFFTGPHQEISKPRRTHDDVSSTR